MFVADLLFRPRGQEISQDGQWAIGFLLTSWFRNGQIVSNNWTLATTRDGCRASVRIPERTSLSSIHANRWVREDLARLRQSGVKPPIIRVIGREPQTWPAVRTKRLRTLILYSTCLDEYPPVRCGETFHPVPLYRLPHLGQHHTYEDILTWQRLYRCCDDLQLHCGMGERFGDGQMSRHDSQLSKDGISICRQIESRTHLPTYYYLHRHFARSLVQELKRRCPGCGRQWLLEHPWHEFLDFRCDRCRLVSNIAFDIRDSARQ